MFIKLLICIVIWVGFSYLINYRDNREQYPFKISDIESKLIFLVFNDWKNSLFNSSNLDRSIYIDYEKSNSQYLYIKSLHNNKVLKFTRVQLLKAAEYISTKYIASKLKVFYYQHSYSTGSPGFNYRVSLSAEEKLDRIFYQECEYISKTFPELFQIINNKTS